MSGVISRTMRRLSPLSAVTAVFWHTHTTVQPVLRSLTAYGH